MGGGNCAISGQRRKVDKGRVIPARLPPLLSSELEAPPVISPLVEPGEELHSAKNMLNNPPPCQTNLQTK